MLFRLSQKNLFHEQEQVKIELNLCVQRLRRTGAAGRAGPHPLPHLLPCWAGLHPPPQPRRVRLIGRRTPGHHPPRPARRSRQDTWIFKLLSRII